MFEKPSVDDMQHLRRLVMLNEGDEGDDNPASLLSPEH